MSDCLVCEVTTVSWSASLTNAVHKVLRSSSEQAAAPERSEFLVIYLFHLGPIAPIRCARTRDNRFPFAAFGSLERRYLAK